MYFNFHTHKRSDIHGEIYNLRAGVEYEKKDDAHWFSIGIHPWDLNTIDVKQAFLVLGKALQQDNCVALGEVGLDKSCTTNFQLQKSIFLRQLAVAKQKKTRIVIIHCVKAYQDIIEVKKMCKGDFIWVLHGFNGSMQLTKQLIKHGFYFSLGSILFNSKAKIMAALPYIPLNRILLETDDSNLHIRAVYGQLASLLHEHHHEVEKQIMQNVHTLLSSYKSHNF